jgi:acetoin utilization deacetylase AcuC-like enzyme
VLPISKAYKPDFVLVSAGFDAAAGDPLGEHILSVENTFYFVLVSAGFDAAAGAPLGVPETGYKP